MALSGALTAHIATILTAVGNAMQTKTDAVVIRSEKAENLATVLCQEIRKAVQAENLSDVS